MVNPGDKNSSGGPKSDDDNLLKDLNIDDVEGLEGAQLAGGQPLPKKVELDIDDMLLEDDEEEAPPEAPIEPAPKPASEAMPEPEPPPASEEEKPPRRKISTLKLVLLILAVVLPLTLIVAPIIYIYFDKPVETTEQQPPPPMPEMVELKPFIINYPTETAKSESEGKKGQKPEGTPAAPSESIVQIIVMIDFADSSMVKEFEEQKAAIRDGLFRYFQGIGLKDIEDVAKQPELSPALTQLVNGYFKQGRVRSVQIVSVGVV